MRITIQILVISILLAGLGQSQEPLITHDLNSLINDYEKFEKEIKQKSENHWPIISDEIIEAKRLKYTELLSALQDLHTIALGDEDIINLEMLQYILSDALYGLQFGDYMMPLNSEGGFITSMIYSVRSTKIESEQQANKYLERLEAIPRYLDYQKQRLEEGLLYAKSHPKLVVERCIQLLDYLLEKSEFEFFCLEPLKDFKNRVSEETMAICIGAFETFREFLEEHYLPKVQNELGITHINSGVEYYNQRIKYYTSLDYNPDDIYNIGIAEVERIKGDMELVMSKIGYTGELKDFIEDLRNDNRFIAKTPEELLYYAAWLSKKAEEILPRYFKTLPQLPFTVVEVPAAIAPTYTAGRYSGGSMKRQKPGEYLVNTYKLESRPMYMLPALTLHEAVPGHHLQGSLAKEMKGLPAFRSQYLSAYGEGWGLYSEYLGVEAGYYKTLYDEFGRLSYEMWRACRLVIDPGIHSKGWSRDKAINYMKEHTALSEHEINTEIDRYIGWPGQAVSYKIGELKIKELRLYAEGKLGKRFDIREFHDVLLSNGSVPLFTLDWIVKKYVEQKLNAE